MNETTELKLQQALNSKGAIKDAIEAKGVTVGNAPFDQYASKIEAIPTPIEEAPENDVNFYDYTGFRVASYTIAQAKALTQAQYNAILPPSHEGLTFQEWNWSLSDITSYNRQYIDIGANYITTDGKTHITARVTNVDVVIDISGMKGTTSVDWGDNSSDSYTHPSYRNTKQFTHTYSSVGFYTIKLSFEQSDAAGMFGMTGTKGGSTWTGLEIHEINCGNYFDIGSGGVGVVNNINTATANISIPKNTSFVKTDCGNSLFRTIIYPKSSEIVVGYQNFSYFGNTKICFPKTIKTFNGWIGYQGITSRIVLPENTDGADWGTNTLQSYFVAIISLPNSAKFATLANGQYINANRVRYVDIVQGWIPNQNMNFSASTYWSADNIVKFFSKLGTTQTAITLTWGSTNLNKLTSDQKAIATNKGYTLA